MTKEQNDALNRVRATYAYSNDADLGGSIYPTYDIDVVLCMLQEQEQKLLCVTEDLEDLDRHLRSNMMDHTAIGMVESMLFMLSYEE